jgi:hypothetical protein
MNRRNSVPDESSEAESNSQVEFSCLTERDIQDT